jgi:adenosine deaminase
MKMLSRNALEFSFLAGKSIWQGRTSGKPVKECVDVLSAGCVSFASSSDKAHAQRDLELRFLEFEKLK